MRIIWGKEEREFRQQEIAQNFMEGFVSAFCQPGGRYSTNIYPSGGFNEVLGQAFHIGDKIGGILNGDPPAPYIHNGELMKWLQNNVPSMIIKAPAASTEPNVDGQCNTRWAGNRCNGPKGHSGSHGHFVPGGLILTPWPNNEVKKE